MERYKKLGIYVHIPFCEKKCPYCDFYSLKYDSKSSLEKQYFDALEKEIRTYKKDIKKSRAIVDTIYFGGGTPSIVSSDNIASVLKNLKSVFKIKDAEITLEANPNTLDEEYLKKLKKAGINRLSLGLQSANSDELFILGRRHSAEDVKFIIEVARRLGFDNISVDLMLGLPDQTIDKVKRSLEFLEEIDVEHISAYMLQIEKNTAFNNKAIIDRLPSEDETAKIYLFLVSRLKEMGLNQYEISNFSKPKKESIHNLKYWNREEYIGLGVAAHSFYNGKRYSTESNIYQYVGKGKNGFFDYNYDDDKDEINEYIMLKLRTSKGIDLCEMKELYPRVFVNEFLDNLKRYYDSRYMNYEEETLKFTTEGFLIYNTLVSSLMIDNF